MTNPSTDSRLIPPGAAAASSSPVQVNWVAFQRFLNRLDGPAIGRRLRAAFRSATTARSAKF